MRVPGRYSAHRRLRLTPPLPYPSPSGPFPDHFSYTLDVHEVQVSLHLPSVSEDDVGAYGFSSFSWVVMTGRRGSIQVATTEMEHGPFVRQRRQISTSRDMKRARSLSDV